MKYMHGLTSLLLALGTLMVVSSCNGSSQAGAGDGDPTLRFAAIPDDNQTELRARFDKIAAHLAQELGVPVQFTPTSDYNASVQAFANGDVHLAWFGGLTGAQARQKIAGSRAIAQGKVDPEYKTYFIANSASGLTPSSEFPKGLAGKRFAFGSNASTSGRLMPEHFIRENTGKSPAEFFGAEMSFTGSHDQTALQVQNGSYDAGALSYKAYEAMVARGAIDPDKCFILWTTPSYADYNWTAHPALEKLFFEGFIDKLQEVLVNISDPELLAALDREEGMIAAKSEDFQAIHDLAIKTGLMR